MKIFKPQKLIKFVTSSEVYKPSDISKVSSMTLNSSMLVTSSSRTHDTKRPIKYFNCPISFDIETTSFEQDNEKCAIMYCWTFGINGVVIFGRTWQEFKNVLRYLETKFTLSNTKRMIIYVHNLAFEFQFLRKHFDWEKIFAIEPRKPLYAITKSGIEFRCSFMLSGYSLKKLGDELQKYPVAKMVGDLDYSLYRHSATPLTDKELKYCENDVRVVMSYIQEQIERDGNITKLPLTRTGYVRQYCRNSCLYDGLDHKKNTSKFKEYRKLMQELTVSSEEYKQLKRAFQGGFTHANANYTEKTLENVSSYDFTSSYPFVMISRMFPMSKGREVKIHSDDEFEKYLDTKCCLFNVKFYNIHEQILTDNPISVSKCVELRGEIRNNGRVASADYLSMTITEQDYFIYRLFYKWDKMEIGKFIIYDKYYLPTDFVKSILKLYSDKTTLKGVKGKEVEYLAGKGMLNATYGMTVTDICRDENIYTESDNWEIELCDIDKAIENYNKSVKRFLFYPWGVWVTAYARRNLFTGIYACGSDYVYSDTDSIKILNAEKHKKYFDDYNKQCKILLERACKYHNIPFDMVEPKTIKGEKKLLGIWDYEGTYDKFKTLGAKRYMIEKNGKIDITVSGVNKKFAVPYMLDNFENVFDCFDDGLYIPADYTGKNTHTYIDDEKSGFITDYLGNEKEFKELSSVHLEKADYSLSMSITYMEYIRGVENVER